MSFSVSVDRGSFEYRARLAGLAAQPSNLLRPRYLRMIGEILRFTREAKALRDSDLGVSTAEFLERGGYSDAFRDDFLLPMVACIWSSQLHEMLSYPAATMVGFLDNHGLLELGNRPQWRTVTGGSREYVRRLAASLPDVRTDTPVVAIERGRDDVTVRTAGGAVARYDHVVMADPCRHHVGHPRRGLIRPGAPRAAILPLPREPGRAPPRPLLHAGASPSVVQLELPRERSGDRTIDGRGISLTYWMNLLQNLDTDRPVFVTLNPGHEPRDVEASFTYHHPQYDRDAVDAQALIPSIQGVQRTWFAGSYCGFGFHEDGLRSGLQIAAALGSPAPWWRDRVMTGLDPEAVRDRSPVVVGSDGARR